jgi:hypothetical protein
LPPRQIEGLHELLRDGFMKFSVRSADAEGRRMRTELRA